MSLLSFLHERRLIDIDLCKLIDAETENSDNDIFESLLESKNFSEEDVAKLKSEYFGLEYTDLENFSKIENLNYEILENYHIIPFGISNDTVHIAINNPDDLESIDKLNTCLSACIETKHLKTKYYISKQSDILYKFQEMNNNKGTLFDQIIFDAIRYYASDIHITPYEKTFEIMFRLDGILRPFKTVNIDQFESLAISIKVLAKLDISETRRPQSGHFQKNNVDFRISTHPTTNGENLVIRVLNKNKSFISIENLGFSNEQREYLQKITSFSNGMIIFCGPTGSGKTTSIYSLLETIDKKSKNIMTLEDPIEYRIQDIKQTEIKRGVINFADGVRSILRQDPDIILIGEIRDEETAQMAVRASLTGHLVLTTVHSNDSFGAITRFKEFGISESLIADNIIAIASQRLLRKKCKFCDCGCTHCNNTGYLGRTVISEILPVDNKISNMICSNVNKQELLQYAINQNGFKTMLDDCITKVQSGVISENDMKNVLRMPVN